MGLFTANVFLDGSSFDGIGALFPPYALMVGLDKLNDVLQLKAVCEILPDSNPLCGHLEWLHPIQGYQGYQG